MGMSFGVHFTLMAPEADLIKFTLGVLLDRLLLER